MTYFLFLYTIVLTLVFGACGFGFLVLFIKKKYGRDLWIAIVFLLFVYDNLKFSISEMIPEFAELYNQFNIVANSPVLVFSYFFAAKYIFRLSFSRWEKAALVTGGIILLVTMTSFTVLGSLISRSVRILFFVYIFSKAFLSLKKNRHKLGESAYKFWFIFLVLCAAAQFAGSVQSMFLILTGHLEQAHRIIGHELFGLICACAAVWYLIKILSRPEESRLSDEELVSLFCRNYNLSAREADLVPLLLEGVQNSEISDRLCISLNTVKVHVHNIYQEIGIERRAQLPARYQEFINLRSSGGQK